VPHIVLLGDSIFDNAASVRGGPDVITHLRAMVGGDAHATLAALDGSVADEVPRQLANVPEGATHLVVSAGGNDALDRVDLVEGPAHSAAEALARVADAAEAFERRYDDMLRAVLARGLPTAVCTVYWPRFPDATFQRLAVTGLTAFNDAILRLAFARGLPVIDLRLVCDDDADYANPIEPSAMGGFKIARAIAGVVGAHDFGGGRTVVYVR
jgi:lysophospholipase L1-like esterase